MKRSGRDRPANCIQGADHVRIPASREFVLHIEAQRVGALAKQALPLAVGHEELHHPSISID